LSHHRFSLLWLGLQNRLGDCFIKGGLVYHGAKMKNYIPLKPESLYWNEPERVKLEIDMPVSYRSVGLWFRRGKIISFDEKSIRVDWGDVKSDEPFYNLYVWTKQTTDQRDIAKD
jgi:hypothetical protein